MDERKGPDAQAEAKPEQRLMQPEDAIEDIELPPEDSEVVQGGADSPTSGTRCYQKTD